MKIADVPFLDAIGFNFGKIYLRDGNRIRNKIPIAVFD